MAKAKLDVATHAFAYLRLNGFRCGARAAVVCHVDGNPLPTETFIVQEDSVVVIGGVEADLDELVRWSHNSGKATVEITSDPKRYGYCTRFEFEEAKA